ncbi:MAG: phosphotransferase, partial [Myxococcales bacterium]|nr:phosphotransferase [Myxococcales bacterium]
GLGRRALAHRDFGPWNWIRGGRRLWVVDLEHARPDLPLVDLTRLASGPWRRRSALADGFFAGFGRALDAEERALLELLGLLHALTTLSWAAEGRAAHLAADAAAVVEGLA